MDLLEHIILSLILKHSISYDSFFNIQEINENAELDFTINSSQKGNV
ncbi:hypothetical protein [Spiroplasma endosymbiont of Danaus chrysippus]|nr:hypothetical protein [Spiroplasma endosymbiont of Danaus chrysippus]